MKLPIRSARRIVVLMAAVALAARSQTGTPVAELSALDRVMSDGLARHGVKGGALAIVKDGHLIFARGYGFGNAEDWEPVQPESLFRWASVSKTLTATAVMRLVEDGKLSLDTPVWSILDQYLPYNGRWGDSQLGAITIRHLLQHTAGWDRMLSGDPVAGNLTLEIARATGSSIPPTRDAVIRYMLAQKLDFAPGTRFSYSNFGYMLLGRVIEKVSGRSYEDYVRGDLLAPMNLGQIQQGKSTLAGRLPGEVKYYDYPGAPLIQSYFSPARELQPAPYGYSSLDLNDADGGWVGSVVDLAKFVAMLDGARPRRAVTADSWPLMVAETPRNTWVDSSGWYGLGMFVTPQLGGLTWSHGGSYPGTRSYFWRFANGICQVFLFNGDSKDQNSLIVEVANSVFSTLANVTEWPDHDLFPQYYAPRIADSGIVNAASGQGRAQAPSATIAISGADLGGKSASVSVILRDSAGAERPAEVLASGPDQIQCVLPDDAANGDATLIVRRDRWPDAEAPVSIASIAPGLFTANAAGVAAGKLLREGPGRDAAWEPLAFTDDTGNVLPVPIAFGDESEHLTLVLHATGLRHATALEKASVQIGASVLAADSCGAHPWVSGLDEVWVSLPRSLAGTGSVPVTVTAEGVTSNTVYVTFQ